MRFASVLIHLAPSRLLSQVKDEAFDEAEKRFRLQERLIKSFIRDISLYLQHIRVRVQFRLWLHRKQKSVKIETLSVRDF